MHKTSPFLKNLKSESHVLLQETLFKLLPLKTIKVKLLTYKENQLTKHNIFHTKYHTN